MKQKMLNVKTVKYPGLILKSCALLLPAVLIMAASFNTARGQVAPTLSYSSPQSFYYGPEPIEITPTSSGVAAPGYSTASTTIASGFTVPYGVVVDAAGNVYVSDYISNQVKKFPAGNGTPVVLGSGFAQPTGIALDAAGNVYVADYGNNAVKKIPAGNGTPVTVGSGFSKPIGVAVDAAGNVYVADYGNVAVKEIPVGGGTPVTLGEDFKSPVAIAVDALGNVYVADNSLNTITEIQTAGQYTIGSGFSDPSAVAVDAVGDVYVADDGNSELKEVPAGTTATVVVGPSIANAAGVAVDFSGNVYATTGVGTVTETAPVGGYYINTPLPSNLTFFNATGVINGYSNEASAATNYTITAYNATGHAQAVLNLAFTLPSPPTLSYSSPQSYVVGTAISTLSPTGTNVYPLGYNINVTTIGSGFSSPEGIAVDASGNLYVADALNNAVKEVPAGSNTPVIIGSGFSEPYAVAVDANGNVYVADYGNNAIKQIPAGNGTVKVLGSGFSHPTGVAVDASGNVYVADRGNNKVKKILPGNGTPVVVGTGFSSPYNVAVDASGNVYVTDYGNDAIKEIPASNDATIWFGYADEPLGITADPLGNLFITGQGPAGLYELTLNTQTASLTNSGFNNPDGVAVDAIGNIYVSDYGTGKITKITHTGGYFLNTALPPGLTFSETNGTITGTPTTVTPATNYTVTAFNTGGTAASVINIATTTEPSPTVSYASPQTYVGGTAIAPLSPTSTNVLAPGYGTGHSVVGNSFNAPTGVATDPTGNVYVADRNNNRVVEIVAGFPEALGSGFSDPNGIAFDASGNLYIADEGNNAVKEILRGSGSYNTPPITLATGFSEPCGVAVDAAGNVYVADYGNNAIKKILPGNSTPLVVGSGFSQPFGVAVDALGNVYVSDYGNSAIKEIPVIGGPVVTLVSGFTTPAGIAVDPEGNLFVTSSTGNTLSEILVGTTAASIIANDFNTPYGVAMAPSGILYVADVGNNDVKDYFPVGGYYTNIPLPAGLKLNQTTGTISGTPTVLSPAMTYTIFGDNYAGSAQATLTITVGAPPLPTISYTGPQSYVVGTAITALSPAGSGVAAAAYSGTYSVYGSGFSSPLGMAIDASGNVYVADELNNAIKEIPANNGSPITLGSGFSTPTGVAVDKAGNVYVADIGNKAVKEIPAGNGTPIVLGSGFTSPTGVAVDAAGNVYVADNNNTTIIKIPAGNGTMVSIGSGLSIPLGVAVDAAGNVYVTEQGNNDVKKIVGGTGTPVVLASGFNTPFYLTLDVAGNVYVADGNNNAIKKIPVGGGTPVIAGSGFYGPFGVALDASGNLYVSEASLSNAIEKIAPVGGYFLSAALPAGLSFNSITGVITGTPTVASPATNYTVTGYNLAGGTAAAINIKTVLSTANANLANLKISIGTLSPSFVAGITSYTASVSNTTTSITVTPVTGNSAATVTVNGTAVTSGSPSGAIALAVGTNTINTIVTAQNGTTTQTYTLTVTRVPATNAKLSYLGLSQVVLSPSFATATTSYTANVANTITSTNVEPIEVGPGATITVNGVAVASGSTMPVALVVGNNTINTVVTAQDGVTSQAYTVLVVRAPSAIATLSNLTLSSGALTPAFAGTKTSYTATVGNTVASITETPTTTDPTATITVNGTTVTSGSPSAAITLSVGSNTITTVVTAQNGTTTDTYTTTVTRAPATNAKLSYLGLSQVVLSPAFATATTSYTASVVNAIASTNVDPIEVGPGATIKVNGVAVASGTSTPVALSVGSNTINTVVTAQDGVTQLTYTVTVTRAPSAIATLASLTLSSGTLSPAFATSKTSYTASVGNTVTSIAETITPTDPTAQVTINGMAATSGVASGALALNVGANTITTVVTAQNGTTTDTYTVTVTRAPSSNAKLSYLGLSKVTLSPAFANATTSYTASVVNSIGSTNVEPIEVGPGATIEVNGVAVASGATTPVTLNVGVNTVNTVVTAQDGVTQLTYSVTVTRAAPTGAFVVYNPISVEKPTDSPQLADDGIVVHQGVSPNGDGIDDYLQIDGITNYPDNKLTIINRSGMLVYEAKGYDNSSRTFDGHSNKNGQMQLPGTYFYSLDYIVNGVSKHRTGYLVLKY